mmetsp:Transcript_26733/g.37683  ORF Transcript_26733/g.37683 Transcript_26733/m.37683 type:complete len:330 (+) Transcript_26733:65-1054(+)
MAVRSQPWKPKCHVVAVWILSLLQLFSSVEPVEGFIFPLSSSPSPSPSSLPSSLLVNTQWKLRLDVGLQPGTWMPKRFPGWAESGARLGVDVLVEFTDVPLRQGVSGESLVGPKDSTFQLKVCINDGKESASTFVSERGQQKVIFVDGGWCLQRPTGNVKNAKGSLVKPEGLLRFWLDCPSGAKRNDVEIFPNTRIFFTTGCWDAPVDTQQQDEEYKDVLQQLQQIVDRTRETRQGGETSTGSEQSNNNLLEDLQTFQKMAKDSKKFEQLKERKETLERQLPPLGAAVASNGVQIAPTGSLVIKGSNIPDWLPGSEYLILGTFSTTTTM